MRHAVGQADEVEGGQDLLLALGSRQREEQQRQLDVFVGGQHGEQMIELKDEADAAPCASWAS